MGKVWTPGDDSFARLASICEALGKQPSNVSGSDDLYADDGVMFDLVEGIEMYGALAPMMSLEDVGAVAAAAQRINLGRVPKALQSRITAAVTQIADAKKITLSREQEWSLRPNFSTVVALSVTAANGSDTATFQIKPPGVGTYANNNFNIIQVTAHTRSPVVSLVSGVLDIKFNGTSIFQNEKSTAGSTLTGAPLEKFGLDAFQTQCRPLRPLSPDNNPIDNISLTLTSVVIAEYLICFDGVIARPFGSGCVGRAYPSATSGGASILRALRG